MTGVKHIKSPGDVIPILKKWANSRQENFLVITLNGAHQVIKTHLISKGLANKTIVHPRECYWPAIKDNAIAVIFAHNHPSGQTEMSPEDLEITDRLCKSAKILGLHVLDHIIFTRNADRWRSLREHGVIFDREYRDYELEQVVAEQRGKDLRDFLIKGGSYDNS